MKGLIYNHSRSNKMKKELLPSIPQLCLVTKKGAMCDIFSAINQGKLQSIKRLIEGGRADINATDDEDLEFQGTPLYYAVRRGETSIVRYLAGRNECNIDRSDMNGYSPLLIACEKGFVTISLILIERGADVNEGPFLDGSHEYTPLLAACLGGHRELCKLLLNEGARMSVTMLVGFIGIEWSELVMSIIETSQSYKNEALVEASRIGTETLCQTLMAKGAKVNAIVEEETALSAASSEGHVDICRFLIEKGAEVNACSQSGRTPLMVACKNGHEKLCKLMIESGANIHVKDEFAETPLMAAVRLGNDEIVKMLIEKDSSTLEKQNWRGETALIHAYQLGQNEVCKILIEKDANFHVRDRDSKTLLMMAASYSEGEELIKLLLDKDPSIIEDKSSCGGLTALMIACRVGNDRTVRCLLERGANLDTSDDRGNSPLIYACSANCINQDSLRSSEAIIQLLLDVGTVTINQANDSGMTGLDCLLLKFAEGKEETFSIEAMISLSLNFLRAGALLRSDNQRLIAGSNRLLPLWPILVEMREDNSFCFRTICENVVEKSAEAELLTALDYIQPFGRQCPRPLQALSRSAILKHLPFGLKNRLQAITKLELPMSLKHYLNFSDLK